MKYLLGVDFGGGASKATLLSETGAVAAASVREYPTAYPHPGWAEQNPDDSLNACLENIRAVLAASGADASDVLALCLDGATHTAVLLDERDEIIRPAIYWTDTRASNEAADLKATCGAELMRLSLNSPSAFWTLPQLCWLRAREPDSFRRIRKVLSMKDYVRYRLTGDFVTDEIEAMGFMLLDANTNQWSDALLDLCGLPRSVMPEIVRPDAILSPIKPEFGLPPTIRVLAGATDTALEVYAAGAVAKGQATVKLATAGRICSVTDRAVVDPMLVTYRHVVPGLWYPGTATRSCASANRWYRDTFGGEFEQMSRDAAAVPRGCDGLYFHPYLQGEITPYLDDALRASFVGASGSHTKSHFNRAVLEGVAYSMKDCFGELARLGIAPDRAAAIGGGAKSPLWRRILCDMLNIPLYTVSQVDSSLGAAMLAGVASGVFDSHAEAVRRCVRITDEMTPDPESAASYDAGFATYKQIQAALAPIYRARRP